MYLFLADFFIALVLESLLHGGQGDLPVILRSIIMKAGNKQR
jgi:hypothetical protein